MITYMTAYCRHYYPAEFIASYLNNGVNDSDTRDGTQLAKLKGIKIEPPTFGQSEGLYQVKGGVIYKGIGSVMYCSELVANDLLQLYKDMQYDGSESFVDVLYCASSLKSANVKSLSILIKIGFFRQYGTDKKLYDFLHKGFAVYEGVKIIKKAGIKNGIANIISLFPENFTETAKQFRVVDDVLLLEEIWKRIPSTRFTQQERLVSELSYLNYVQSSDLFALNAGVIAYNKSKNGSFLLRTISGEEHWIVFEQGVREPNKLDMIFIHRSVVTTTERGKYSRRNEVVNDYELIVLDRATRNKETKEAKEVKN